MNASEERHTADLTQQLADARATIAALLAGELDAVVDPKDGTFELLTKAREALKDSEARYRYIVETTNEGVWLIDAGHKTTLMNRRMAEILGCESDMGVGRTPFEFLSEAGRAGFASHLEQPNAHQVELEFVRADGTSVWALVDGTPAFDSTGQYKGSIVMVRDVSERKLAAEALAELSRRTERRELILTSTLSYIQDFAYIYDRDGRFLFVNQPLLDLWGITLEDAVGKNFFDLGYPDDLAAQLQRQIQEVFETKTSLTGETPYTSPDGLDGYYEYIFSPAFGPDGTVEFVAGSTRDITERKRAAEALRAAEERMRFALDTANVGIWDMDYSTGALTWSQTLEAQYGLEPGGFGGTFEAFVELIHPDDRESLLATVGAAMKTGGQFTIAHRARWRDGTVQWLTGSGRIFIGHDGNPVRGLGISQNVTERRLLERQYQQAQKMEAIGQLASGIAHDFNNLLTVIQGFTAFVAEDATLGQRHAKDLGEVIKAAERAAALTKQLLAFSRKQVLQTAPLDVNAVLTDMNGMLGRLIGEHIQVSLVLAPSLCLALADRGQLEQVVMNLVVNARDAMPGGGLVTIETTDVELENSSFHQEAIMHGHYVMLAVTDTGSGMTEETKQHLFEPFFTTKESGKGTGLGLSTTYGIVKQSKGYIWVYSELGRGTTFKVYLPCANPDATVPTVRTEVTAPRKRTSETVLLVEDEEGLRLLSKRILENAGYQVWVAANGNDAESVFAQHADSIDLIVTDVVMPGCGGPELLSRLRQRAPTLRVWA